MSYIRAIYNWWKVSVYAAYYGSISILFGGFSHKISQWAMWQWCKKLIVIFKIRQKWINGEKIAQAPQCIFVANHLSSLDILVLGSFIQQDYRWLAKSVLFKIPFSGWHLSLSGHIPVFRGKQKYKNKALPKRIHKVVEEGASLLFFPEGSRSADGELHSFHLGAFRAAVEESLPILPLVIRDTDKLMKKNAIDRSLNFEDECSVTVLDLIYPSDLDQSMQEKISSLQQKVYDVMYEEFYEQSEYLQKSPKYLQNNVNISSFQSSIDTNTSQSFQ